MTSKLNAATQAAVPASAITAIVAGQLPSQLATSNSAQPSETSAVMAEVASLTGTSAPRDAK